MSRALYLSACLLAAALGAAAVSAAPADCYVAVGGSDAWSGTLARPNAARSDGPFATLARAVAVTRARRQADPARPHTIAVLPGVYPLAETVVLQPGDSGLTISGDRATVLSGGCRVEGFRPWRGATLQASLAALPPAALRARELYYNGKPMPWARTPNFDPRHPRTGGFLQNSALAEKDTKTCFVYREGDLHPERWAHPERAWMMFHDSLNYETQYCPVKRIDPAARTVEAERGVYRLTVGNPFYLCGIVEELDAPGEWCLDPDAKVLYFRPPAGKLGEADRVVLPVLQSLVKISGEGAANPVHDVTLTGLALRDCSGGAVEVTGARACAVTACDLRNVGIGVTLGDDTHACRVAGCDITQTRGDGVSVLGTSRDHERVTDHVIDNNYIWDIGWGRIHNRCGGVYMHRVSRCRVTHNLIHDTPRYAIGMDVGGDCEIAYNVGHHSNLVTLDTSIIEAATALDWGLPSEEQLERNRKCNWGNCIHHNVIHDSGGWGTDGAGQLRTPLYSWGIYLDTHSSGWQVHDNLVYNTVLGAYMVNGGMENVFENNVCVDGQQHQAYLSVWPKYLTTGNVVRHNLFCYQGKSANLYTVRDTDRKAYAFDGNLAWAGGDRVAVSGVPGASRKASWEAWLKLGQDAGTVIADPQFVDAAHRNYALQPGSPALKLGVRPLDLTRAGVYASAERRTWPRPEVPVVRDSTDYSPAAVAAPRQASLRDYESYAIGESERNAHVGNKEGGTALVSEETGAPGPDGTPSRRSLKFTDAAGLGQSFFPYVTYPLEQDEGSLRMGFDLRWERGGLLALDWRDDPYHYNLGPNLTTSADGWLAANGKRLLQLPAGQWVHVAIDCLLGEQATGTYDLSVTLPGAAPQVFARTACSPQFASLNCVVFMAVGDAPGVFYLDNLTFAPHPGAQKE